MQALLTSIKNEHILSKTLSIGLLLAVITIVIALNVDQSHNRVILSVGEFLSGTGNKLFLIISNLMIIRWAWRNRLRSVIKLTLLVDLAVLIFVQGIKHLNIIGSWNIRPHGGTDGFPSGHTTHAFAMAFLLTLFFPRFVWLWYVCAAAISWSRIETNSHYGFQIFAGVILGTGIVWILTARWLKSSDAAIIKPHSSKLSRTL